MNTPPRPIQFTAASTLLLATSSTAFANPIELNWFYTLPNSILSAMIVLLSISLIWMGLITYRRRRPAKINNRRAGYYATMTGSLLGVLIAITAADPWNAYITQQLMQLPATAAAPETPPGQARRLFDDPDDQYRNQPPRSERALIALAERHVGIDPNALNEDMLELELADDLSVTAVRIKTEQMQGGTAWIGQIDGDDGSQVILASKGRTLAGTVLTQGRLFEIVYVNGKTHAVRELDQSQLPQDDPEAPVPEVDGDIATDGTSTTITTTSAPAGTKQMIDLMVVYSPQAVSKMGTEDALKSTITAAIAAANTAYDNSQINVALNPVYYGQVNYTEPATMPTALTQLQSKTDGIIDDIHALRDQYSADLVVLVDTNTDYCGYGYIMNSSYTSSAFAPYAFAVVNYSCLSLNSLAHEIGHLQGNQHNTESTTSTGAYSYSYGYRVCGIFRDIMSYDCPTPNTGTPRVLHFSNPNVTYQGLATGSSTANAAQTINNTAAIVANFRVPLTTPPNAPTNLLATANTTNNSISLNWSDNAATETGYKVQSSLDGSNWTDIATLNSNATSYTDSNLISGMSYSYRVYAYNGIGNSAFSNTVTQSLSAPQADTSAPTVTVNGITNGGTVSGNSLTISATASDNIGVTSMKLYIDNSLKSSSSSGTLSYNWNIKKLSSGSHTVRVDATDAANNLGTISVSVTK
ncbi:M12 family metallo-peptidase [Thiospirillum jenense]|uniref:Fibronectin type III domain-containing protein n=1 Tax=Thiospirillum jenense TaxID=1653858 RepID=A0A839HE77_9GAMM|nr:M12 family metallo-peptidase [Thiospirillum jenense]MBB1125319.1 fibronectin type III domain-containing protein [Thiospirillum jenense]